MLLILMLASGADARATRIVIASRQPIAGGASFGSVGPYEKLTGTVFFEVDPENSHNESVFDLERAPRNSAGKIEFSADTVILRPVDPSRGNHQLFFEVNNRGNKIALIMLNDTPPTANNNNPITASDFGNGFLMRQGYVVAWVGWGADIAPGGSRLLVNFPIAIENGQPITERILTEFSDRNFGGGTPFTLPLSGGTAFNSYPAVSTDKKVAEAVLRARSSDSPRPSGPQIPPGEVVPDAQWSFANCPAGPPGTPSVTAICLAGMYHVPRAAISMSGHDWSNRRAALSLVGEALDGDEATVKTLVAARQGAIPVDYLMVRRGDRWRAGDIVISGMSLVRNFRAQFDHVIKRVSYEQLVNQIRDKQ